MKSPGEQCQRLRRVSKTVQEENSVGALLLQIDCGGAGNYRFN
jgi:hypothetical protein